GFLAASRAIVPLSSSLPMTTVYLPSSTVRTAALKNSDWSFPASVAFSTFQVPFNPFHSSASSARAADAGHRTTSANRPRRMARRRVGESLLTEDDVEHVLDRLKRLTAGDDAVQSVPSVHRCEAEREEGGVGVLKYCRVDVGRGRLAVHRFAGWGGHREPSHL